MNAALVIAPLPPEPSAASASASSGEVVARTGRAIGWSAMQQLGINAVSFISYIVLARLLKPGDFGLLAYATVFITLLQAFVDQGIPDAVVQRADLKPSHLHTAFWFNLAVSCLLAGALALAAPGVASILGEPRLGPILRALALVLPLSALGGIHQALLKRRLDYRLVSLQNFLAAFAGTITALILACRGGGVWSLVGQQLASGGCTAFCAILFCPWLPRFVFAVTELRELFRFSFHITSGALLDFINRRADDFLIGFFLGTTALGIYSLAYRLLVTFTRFITAPLNSVAFSAFSRLQGDNEERRRLFYRLTRLAASAAFPLFLGVAAVAPDFLGAIFGLRWIESAPILRILCLIGILHSVALIHGTLLRASGRPGWQVLFTLGGATTNLVGFFFLVKFGVAYVAGWYVLSAYLWLGVDLVLIRWVLVHRTLDYLRGFVPALLIGVAVAAAMLGLQLALAGHLSVYARLALEMAVGGALLAFFYRSLLLNPRLALHEAGLLRKAT
jgi:PST family polysaccharide transporter